MIHNSLTVMVEKEILTQNELEATENQLIYTTDIKTALKDADFVIEVVPEILDLKWETYEKVESIVSEKTIIASNTSAIPLTQLTEKAKYPERFIITHFFRPSQIVPLVEIVKADSTPKEIVDATYELMKIVGKVPVVLQKEVPGFIANRMQMALLREAFWLYENGVASAEDIDTVIKESLGFRYVFLGPLEGQDIAGLNTPYYVSQSLFPVLSDAKEPPASLKKMIDNNELGIRSGKGFYTYEGNEAEKKLRARDNHFLEVYKLKK